MPEKKGLLKKLEENKKKQVLFFVVCMAVIIGAYFPLNNIARNSREKITFGELRTTMENEVLYDIEAVVREEGKLEISGWMFRVDTPNKDIHVYLEATDDSDAKVIDTKLQERDEVANHFVPGWNFGECGFSAEIKEKELKKDVCYEIFLVSDYEQEIEIESELVNEIVQKKVFTGKYLFNGELYRYNPKEFYAPQVIDSELVNVIQTGILRGYDLEEQIWIYQLENELYFITNPEFGSLEEKNYKVPVMSYTTQTELLPEHRIQYGFDHLGAYFEDETYEREGVVPYQIVRVALSNNYPSTYVVTGRFDVSNDTWIKRIKFPVVDWSLENFTESGEE